MTKRPPKPSDVPSRPRFKRSKQISDARIGPDLARFVDETKAGFSFRDYDASDSEIVLSAAGALDNLLRIAIGTTFRAAVSFNDMKGIFEGNGPLSTLDSKIRVASALGIIPGDFRDDVDLIRSIRNSFAHSISTRHFSDNDIKQKCLRLKLRYRFPEQTTSELERRRFVEAMVRICEFLVTAISFSMIIQEFVVKHATQLTPAATLLAGELLKTMKLAPGESSEERRE
jgi:DNA-binding MltR family transcriptional regulator